VGEQSAWAAFDNWLQSVKAALPDDFDDVPITAWTMLYGAGFALAPPPLAGPHQEDSSSLRAEVARPPVSPRECEPSSEQDALDARRWRALLECGRIRILGTAFINDNGKPPADGYAHFGAEFWTTFPGDQKNDRGRHVLTTFADTVIDGSQPAGEIPTSERDDV
jgi:hypothetical protein